MHHIKETHILEKIFLILPVYVSIMLTKVIVFLWANLYDLGQINPIDY